MVARRARGHRAVCTPKHWMASHSGHRLTANAWLRHARRERRSPAPRADLVRSTHQPECDWLNGTIGRERLIQLTCNPRCPTSLSPSCSGAHPSAEIFARIEHVSAQGLRRFRLTASTHRHAGGQRTLLLDVAIASGPARSPKQPEFPCAGCRVCLKARNLRRINALERPPPASPGDTRRRRRGRPGRRRSRMGIVGRAPSPPPSHQRRGLRLHRKPPRPPRPPAHFCHAAPACGTSWASPTAPALAALVRETFATGFPTTAHRRSGQGPPAAMACCGALLFGERTRTSILKPVQPSSVSPPPIPRPLRRAVMEESPSPCAIPYLFDELAIPSPRSGWAAAPAVRSGVRSRPISTAVRSSCSPPGGWRIRRGPVGWRRRGGMANVEAACAQPSTSRKQCASSRVGDGAAYRASVRCICVEANREE